jgi:hypothetical protein
MFEPRTYRGLVSTGRLTPFAVVVKETDLMVHAAPDLRDAARELVLEHRGYIEAYIRQYPVKKGLSFHAGKTKLCTVAPARRGDSITGRMQRRRHDVLPTDENEHDSHENHVGALADRIHPGGEAGRLRVLQGPVRAG